MRAQSKLFETLPAFAAAILIARVVYVPLYAAGVPYIRSLVWLVSLDGMLPVLIPIT